MMVLAYVCCIAITPLCADCNGLQWCWLMYVVLQSRHCVQIAADYNGAGLCMLYCNHVIVYRLQRITMMQRAAVNALLYSHTVPATRYSRHSHVRVNICTF